MYLHISNILLMDYSSYVHYLAVYQVKEVKLLFIISKSLIIRSKIQRLNFNFNFDLLLYI